jgi:cytochrome c oxidase subunit 2
MISALLSSCNGPQSALDPAGYDAERLAELFWIMSLATIVIWTGVMGLAFYAARCSPPPRQKISNLLILGGGVVFTVVVLAAHLVYGFALMASLRQAGGPG